MPTDEFRLTSISKKFTTRSGEITAVLDDLSISVRRSEVLCLVGPSGCGKTTLLRVLAGIESPDSGIVAIREAKSTQVAYMPQSESLLPWRTVGGNVRLGLEIQRCDRVRAERRVDHLLEKIGLIREKNRYPSELSGGMRRRVALARTLAVAADLLLLDEPLTSLDFVARLQLAKLVREEALTAGLAAVIVTHSIDEAVVLADRVIVLQGRPARVQEDFILGEMRIEAERTGSLSSGVDGKIYDRIVSSLQGLR